MKSKKRKPSKALIAVLTVLALIAGYFLLNFAVPRLSVIGKDSPHKVYVALGFHINLYHSFRIDTEDESGFGKDIRIIRSIIDTLDEYNAEGVPVRAVWDVENLFSAGEMLPQYAPDIISNIQRRVRENGDEVILMSYNNGLVSGLTEREFNDSIGRAISNSAGTGIADLFDDWSATVRPQEMMTTPGNFELYRRLGVDTLCLYYSAVTFDAFRAFVPELTREQAHNPLIYTNTTTGESIRVQPTYNIGDLIENTSLYYWAKTLRREQLRGEITNDVLIFINHDADDVYWYGYNLPDYMSWLPNAGGLDALLDEVKDLDYVEFVTLEEYLDEHEALTTVSFNQDTADGTFDGLCSWAEKPTSTEFWTALVADRRAQTFAENAYATLGRAIPDEIQSARSNAYEHRLRLASTTHFGIAAPFIAQGREAVARELTLQMDVSDDKILESAQEALRVSTGDRFNPFSGDYETGFILTSVDDTAAQNGFVFFEAELELPDLGTTNFYLKDGDLYTVDVTHIDGEVYRVKFCLMSDSIRYGEPYRLYLSEQAPDSESGCYADSDVLSNRTVTVRFDDDGIPLAVEWNGETVLGADSIVPVIDYDGKSYRPESDLYVTADGENGVAQVHLMGSFTLPDATLEFGYFDHTLTVIEGLPYLFIDGEIRYPETERKSVFKAAYPALTRLYDPLWEQVAPCPLNYEPAAGKDEPFTVLKRNYLGVETAYTPDYREFSRRNAGLDNINNQITAEYAGITTGTEGFAVAYDETVAANFAFCPMKMDYARGEFTMSLNPFGTYFGEQYRHPTWGNMQGFWSTIINSPQHQSSAPAFNGSESEFSLMLTAFDGDVIPDNTKTALIGYAHPPVVTILDPAPETSVDHEPGVPHGMIAVDDTDGSVWFHWEQAEAVPVEYMLYLGTESGNYSRQVIIPGYVTLTNLTEYSAGVPWSTNLTYYATMASVSSNREVGYFSDEIDFTVDGEVESGGGPKIPLKLQLKIFRSSIMSYVR